jgi:hypothetical protein
MVTLNEMSSMVNGRMPFHGNSVFATWVSNSLYVVYSYGTHFPMYVYDAVASVFDEYGNALGKGVWLGNSDRYSVTTSKHQGKTRPYQVHKWLNTEQLKDTIHEGSYTRHLIFRGEPLAA